MRLGEQAGSGSQAKVYVISGLERSTSIPSDVICDRFKATYQGAEVACKVMWTIRDFDEVNAVKALAQEVSYHRNRETRQHRQVNSICSSCGIDLGRNTVVAAKAPLFTQFLRCCSCCDTEYGTATGHDF